MRGILVLFAIAGIACGSTVRSPSVRWVRTEEPQLGLSLEVGDGWSKTSIDDAVLLAPTTAGEDYAILVVRTGSKLDARAVLARFGALDQLALSATTARDEAILHASSGNAVLASSPVVVRVAQLRDPHGSTFVAAVMVPADSTRGGAAFERVVDSVALRARPAPAREPQYPAWLEKVRADERAETKANAEREEDAP